MQMTTYGSWTEDSVAASASALGLPDFVYRAKIVRKGSATRELGDVLLWVGDQLVVVSVKSREITRQATDSDARVTSWAEKAIKQASRQINGTVRALRNQSEGLYLHSDRGVQIPWEPKAVNRILGVIVVECPAIKDYYPGVPQTTVPAIVLQMDDWRLLLNRIISITSLANYVAFRADIGVSGRLGSEWGILSQVLRAETSGERNQLTASEVIRGRWWEPDAPSDAIFGSLPDHRFALVVDELIAGAADQNPEFSTLQEAHEYLWIVEFLDRILPMQRIDLGKKIIDTCKQAKSSQQAQRFIAPTPGGLLLFYSSSERRDLRVKQLQVLAAARHSQFSEMTGCRDFKTLAIATEPTPNAGRSHDFFYLNANFRFTDQEREKRDRLFGAFPASVDEAKLIAQQLAA